MCLQLCCLFLGLGTDRDIVQGEEGGEIKMIPNTEGIPASH